MFLIVSFAPAIVVFIMTVVLAFTSRMLQRKLVDRKKMKENQTKSKENMKLIKQYMKEGESKKAELDRLQKENLELQMSMMKGSNKVMMVSLPIFLVFLWALGTIYGGVVFESLFALPKFAGYFPVNLFAAEGWTLTTGYIKAYFFYSLVSSIVMWVLFKAFDTVVARVKERKMEEDAGIQVGQ